MPTRPPETVLAHVQNLRPVTEIRRTILVSSVGALRSRGHLEAYLERIDSAHRDAIFATGGPAWLPIDVAMAHYEACDGLALVGFAGVVGRAIEFGGGRAVRVSVKSFDVDQGEIAVDAEWV